MTTRRTIAVCVLLACSAIAAPPESRTVDFSQGSAPMLSVYRRNVKAYLWTVRSGGTALCLSNNVPFMSWWTNSASSVITARCAVVSAAAGTFTANWTADALDSVGVFTYSVGTVSNGVTTARQGRFVLQSCPYTVTTSSTTTTTLPIEDGTPNTTTTKSPTTTTTQYTTTTAVT